MNTGHRRWLPLVVVPLGVLAGCAKPTPLVSYGAEVVPILDKHCKSCHVPGQPGYIASGFNLEGYDSLMKGTTYGPVVLPGDALTSTLVMLIEGRASPALKMPHGDAPPMSSEEIRKIRIWVEQGAKNN